MSSQFYCELCGGLFNKPAKGNKRMFCDDCKPQAEKLYQAEYYKRRKGSVERLKSALRTIILMCEAEDANIPAIRGEAEMALKGEEK